MAERQSFDIDGLMVFRSDLTAVDQDGNVVPSVITPDRYVQNWREPATDEQIGRLTNTTAYWRENNTYIPRKGEVIIYSDGSTTEQGGATVYIPKIKIGDGVTTVGNLPFTDSDTQQGIAGTMNTTNTTAQTPNASESLSGDVNLHKVSKTGSYDDLNNKPTIPTVNDATLTIQRNSTTVDTFSANASQDKTIDITVPVRIGDLDDVTLSEVSGGDILIFRGGKTNAFINIQLDEIALPASTRYAASLSLSVDSSTYVVTAQLKDQDGNNLGSAATIDLPLESVVVSGSYNSQTKKVVLTLQNGSTIEFSVADLVAGLQSEITAQNPLSADLVVDGTTNKVFTLTMKTKLDGIEAGAEVNVQSDWDETDTSSDAYILHKPTLFSGDYNDLTNKPTIPAAQVNSDWNANSGVAQILNKPDLNATLYESVTYSQLVTKINNSQLVKGRKYRITDYVTTTTQSNTSSAGHAFDLVVTATDVNKLDCKASALLHSGDTYFSTARADAFITSADLSKWQIWYDVENNKRRFKWADSTNGKGVIYRMIDEWGNDCPYDFKNILFTIGGYTDVYTFNKFASGDTSNKDHSFKGAVCYGNVIKQSKDRTSQMLNFIVFNNDNDGALCYSNIFGDACAGNVFGSDCRENIFGENCGGITFGNNCTHNTIGKNCGDLTFGGACSSNTFGNNCHSIIFGDSSTPSVGGDLCKNIIVEEGNWYIRLYYTASNNLLQNIYIAQGCSGTASAYTEISTIARNLAYRTTVGRDSSGNIRIYNEDDPASASQAQANWNETSSSSPSYIQNKPTIPAAQVQTDWNATSGMGVLLNKPTIPDSTSDLTNDSGFITANDVPTEVIWFTFSLSGSTYTSSITPSQILTYLESNDKCVLGIYPNSKDTTKKDVYHCMNHTHDTANNTYSLLFATAKERTLTYFLYDSTVGSWKQSEYPMQAILIGSGTGQNIKTVNNNSLLGSGNITIHEGDDNVQSDWSQTNTSADDYIKNKPQNLVTDASYVHTDNNYTTTEKNKLAGIASGAEVNVQSDWNQADSTADDYIKNKPTIPTVPTNVSAFTNDAGYLTQETDPTVPSWAKAASKPSYDYSEIANTPTIPTHRTINHEQITDSSLGDANLHDGFYFPNAVQDYDGNWYGAVVIGDQVWLGENLRTTHLADGTVINNGSQSGTNLNYHDYSTHTLPVEKRGLLYSYPVANAASGAIIANWKTPTSDEYSALNTYLSKQTRYPSVVKSMAATSGWASSETANAVGNNLSLNNSSGLTLYPSGGYSSNGESNTNNCILWATKSSNLKTCLYLTKDSTEYTTDGYNYSSWMLAIRLVSVFTPQQFRAWYVAQYGSINHQLVKNIGDAVTIYNGTTTPSSSLGDDGDIYIQTTA